MTDPNITLATLRDLLETSEASPRLAKWIATARVLLRRLEDAVASGDRRAAAAIAREAEAATQSLKEHVDAMLAEHERWN